MKLALMVPASLIEIMIIYYYWFSMFELKFEKKKSAIIYFALSFVNMVKCLFMYQEPLLKSVTTIIFHFVMIQILFKDKLYKKAGVYVIYLMCVIMAEFTAMFFGKYIYNCETFSTTEVSLPNLMWQLTAYLFIYMFSIVTLIILKRKKVSSEDRVTRYVFLYGSLQYLILFVFIMLAVQHIEAFMTVVLLVCFLLAVSGGMVMLIYKTVRTAAMQTIEAEYIKKEAEIKDRHFSELKEQYAEYKRLKHDFKNHLRIIEEIKEPEKMAEYTSEVKSIIEKMERRSFCDNLTLDALLALKKTEAERKNIKISYEICDISDIDISDFDLCSVVSNLLDNAIEAADKTKEKSVRMTMDRKLHRFVIITENSSRIVDMSLKTTKADSINHGIGLDSVKNIANKYDGDIVCTYKDGKFTAVVSLELQSKKEKEVVR